MDQNRVVIIDLGSTENSVLARLIRSMGVYSEIQPHDFTLAQIQALPMVKGVIFHGGPNRVVDGRPVQPDAAILASGIPCLAFGCSDLGGINRERFDEAFIRGFVFDVCGCKASWSMDAFIDEQVRQLR